jgi:hypothetical protein
MPFLPPKMYSQSLTRIFFIFLLNFVQRNVGILEKIVQSMTNQRNTQEADLQYNAQVDVISQLAKRVEEQLKAAKQKESGAAKTAIIKLERDFNQVQERVTSLQTSVTKMKQQQAAKRQAMAAAAVDMNDASPETMGYEEFQQHMELQLQQDVRVTFACIVRVSAILDSSVQDVPFETVLSFLLLAVLFFLSRLLSHILLCCFVISHHNI